MKIKFVSQLEGFSGVDAFACFWNDMVIIDSKWKEKSSVLNKIIRHEKNHIDFWKQYTNSINDRQRKDISEMNSFFELIDTEKLRYETHLELSKSGNDSKKKIKHFLLFLFFWISFHYIKIVSSIFSRDLYKKYKDLLKVNSK